MACSGSLRVMARASSRSTTSSPRALREAVSRIFSTRSPNSRPAPWANLGARLAGVKAGREFSSKMYSLPSFDSTMSTMVMPEQPSAWCALRAWVSTPRYRTSDSRAGRCTSQRPRVV